VAARPIQIRSVVDQVHAALREQILSGELERGSRLPQETLAAELGVSRTPLREALRRLAGEGLVILQPHHGATVADLDFSDMSDAWMARLVIEPPAARLAAGRHDAGQLQRMREAIAAQRASADRVADSLDANRDFHLALVAASGNPHLSHFAELLWVARISSAIYAAQADEPAAVLGWADEHEAIVAAIAGGDGDAAERLTREHIVRHPAPESPSAS
jgi:DNA-binding GntR family transcriptional regulator